jgi:hypothetical protein
MTQQAAIKRGNQTFVESEWFVARITSVGAAPIGTGTTTGIPHGWKEQKVSANGYSYEDVPANARPDNGTAVYNGSPAFPIGGGKAVVNDIVLMRARGVSDQGYPIMEFMAKGGGSGSGSSPSSVQCIGNVLYVTYE